MAVLKAKESIRREVRPDDNAPEEEISGREVAAT